MSLFGEQFLSRRKRYNNELNNAIWDVIDAANGTERFHFSYNADENARKEIEEICVFLKANADRDIPEYKDMDELMDYATRHSAIMRRHIKLKGDWWIKGTGPVLAVKKDSGVFVALLPGRVRGYYYFDRKTERPVKINKKNKNDFEEDAVVFYRAFPLRPISIKELLLLLLESVSGPEILTLFLATLAVTSIGLLTPAITKLIFSLVIPTGKKTLIASFTMLLTVTAAIAYIISTMKIDFVSRIKSRMQIFLLNGAMGRMMHFPTSFYEGRSTGALSAIFKNLLQLPVVLANSVMVPVINTLFSAMFIIQIALMAPSLMRPAIITFVIQILIIVICTIQSTELARKEMYYDSKIEGLAISVYDGIQRIKLSGSESRVLTRWSHLYTHKASAAYPVVFPTSFQEVFIIFAGMMGTMAAYYTGFRDGIDVSQFAAFLSSYGFVTGSMMELGSNARLLPMVSPTLKMAEEIFKVVPEISDEKKIVRELKGKVEVRDLSFRYTNDSPLIFNGLDLTIDPGEYVAIVGESGCGKSTLMRLLMGFETPIGGNILYDEMDIDRIDPRSLRRNIGAVLQDGELFNESIYTNIAISAPDLTMEDAWELAEMVGIADDIRRMPMGMNTLIPQGGGGISGGQKQRIMIARALAPKPSILMFDEATSALDNIIQKTVADALGTLDCTRIVIAQRLSTIKLCDRIIVLDKGRIAEDGTYDELMAAKGLFAELVERQRLDHKT